MRIQRIYTKMNVCVSVFAGVIVAYYFYVQ